MTCQTIQTQFLLSQRLQVGAGFSNEKNPAQAKYHVVRDPGLYIFLLSKGTLVLKH